MAASSTRAEKSAMVFVAAIGVQKYFVFSESPGGMVSPASELSFGSEMHTRASELSWRRE
jgi:hypothetical protein